MKFLVSFHAVWFHWQDSPLFSYDPWPIETLQTCVRDGRLSMIVGLPTRREQPHHRIQLRDGSSPEKDEPSDRTAIGEELSHKWYEVERPIHPVPKSDQVVYVLDVGAGASSIPIGRMCITRDFKAQPRPSPKLRNPSPWLLEFRFGGCKRVPSGKAMAPSLWFVIWGCRMNLTLGMLIVR